MFNLLSLRPSLHTQQFLNLWADCIFTVGLSQSFRNLVLPFEGLLLWLLLVVLYLLAFFGFLGMHLFSSFPFTLPLEFKLFLKLLLLFTAVIFNEDSNTSWFNYLFFIIVDSRLATSRFEYLNFQLRLFNLIMFTFLWLYWWSSIRIV